MSQYKCTNSFICSKGRRYSYGNKILLDEYNSLSYSERNHFTDYEEESSSIIMNAVDFLSSMAVDDTSSNIDTSSNDFSGFSGGDSGGGGASGDW